MASINQHPAMQQSQGKLLEIPIGDSSFLQHFKYDAASFQLTVTMKNGSQYIHFYVYPGTVDQLIQAPSKGKFYADNIKGKYPGARTVSKGAGKPIHNPLKGPIEHERKSRKQFARVAI